jgi:hypothetical protein
MFDGAHACARVDLFECKSMHSKNGVFVNDRRIEAVQLVPGDVIVFGGATPTTKVGDLLPQPMSEFRYTFELERPALSPGPAAADNKEESVVESTFASMKALTENITVIFTWISSLVG